MSAGQEVRFERNGRGLTGIRWHRGGVPTLALHGWLDNANSFNYLAPRLTELDIIALDFAGHGHSDHRHADVAYSADLDIEDVLAVASQAGWEQFNLIGHSMGAEYGSQLAGLFPERVKKLICIEGFVESATSDQMLAMRAKRIKANLSPRTSTKRIFDSIEEMTDRVVKAAGQNYDSAFELVQRGHVNGEDGFTWITDSRLKQDAWELIGSNELAALVKQTTAPTLVIDASDGQHWFRSVLEVISEFHPSLKVVKMDGSHHLHMENPSSAMVLAEIRNFLGLSRNG